MTLLSNYFLPTVKEAPADAEAVSHKLLVRAGMVRQVGAGMWSFLPAGWRVHRKVEQGSKGTLKKGWAWLQFCVTEGDNLTVSVSGWVKVR
jgi:prolyl-tRNA synthetase